MVAKKDYARTDRLNELLQRELAQIIQQEVKDPRLGMITVSGVEITRDLSHAKIYVSIFAPEQDIKQNIQVLNHATGYIRSLLATKVKLRIMPELHFIYDATIVEGQRLSSIIDKAIAEDEEKNK